MADEKELRKIQSEVNEKMKEIAERDDIESVVGSISVVPVNGNEDEEGIETLGVNFVSNATAIDALQMAVNGFEESIKSIVNETKDGTAKVMMMMLLNSSLQEMMDNIAEGEKGRLEEELGIDSDELEGELKAEPEGVDVGGMPDFVKEMLGEDELENLKAVSPEDE